MHTTSNIVRPFIVFTRDNQGMISDRVQSIHPLLHDMTRVTTKHGIGMKGALKYRNANREGRLDLLAIKETGLDS